MSYTSILKPSSYITVEEACEWLNLSTVNAGNPSPEVKASKEIQDLLYVSKLVGAAGNATAIQYASLATPGVPQVEMLSSTIVVRIENNITTSQDIKNAIEAHPIANALVTISFKTGSTGVEPQTLQNTTSLVGGKNEVLLKPDEEKTRRLIERLINTACDKVENILQTCVIAKDYEDTLDGNNSNVIIPSKWPVIGIKEIKIDYNRGFSSETIISPKNWILRGYADRRQATTDVSVRIIGNDVVLRDDGRDSIIGRIFSGSVLGSVKVKFTAGWALNKEDIPYDLQHATMLLFEYYFFQRSNRDLGVISKTIKGDSSSKVKDGIPDTITELLQPYCDISLPLYEKSQTNVFGL